MALSKSRLISIIVGGMLLNFSGLLMAKANSDVFGLPADFWAGFLIAVGVAVVALGVILARKPASSS